MADHLRFSQLLDARAGSDPDEAIMVTILQGKLGTTLSSAFWTRGDMVNEGQTAPGYEDTAYQSWLQTPQGQRYQDRLDAFNAVGMEQLFYDEDGTYAASDDPDRRMGYDVAMDLFEQSHVPVDEKFFDQTMNHLMELERETPDIWHYARYRGDTADDVIPENDVVDRFLGIGAENPEAVATFFDPHVNGNLDYFLGDGESSRDIQPSPTETGQSPGLAAALEAAATGISPGTDPGGNDQGHSPANIRIAEEVWNTFATDRSRIEEGGGSEFLRPTLGVIAADYIADIQPAAQQLSRHEEAQFRTVGTGLLVAELARDQEAYELITAANNAYTDTRIEAAFVSNANDPDEIEHDAGRAAAQGGYLTGLMTDAYATAKYEDALEGDAGHNENVGRTKEYTDMLVDNIIARIPVAGGLIGEGASRISDFTFGQFEADSQVTAAQVSENEYEASRDACVVGSRRSGRAAFMEAGIEGVEWDDIRDEIEEQAGFGFDAGTTRDHPQ
jgi:hypothetical protein